MPKEFKLSNKEVIASALNNLQTKQKDKFSANEIAKSYRANISSALKKGYSFKEITDIFNANECNITAKELELAFNKLRRNYKSNSINKKPVLPETTA